MSDKPQQPLTQAQRQEIVNKMFTALHGDLGAILKLLTARPTTEGFVLDTEAVGVASLRLTRSMGALERLIRMNGGQVAAKPNTAADGALIGGFAPAPATPAQDGTATAQSLDSAFRTGGEGLSLVQSTLLGSVGSMIEGATKAPTA